MIGRACAAILFVSFKFFGLEALFLGVRKHGNVVDIVFATENNVS